MGYDNTKPGRLPDLLPHVSAKRIKDWGADAVKILIYYSPFDDEKVNDIKHAFIERIGSECEDNDIPFFLEFVGYDPKGGNEKGIEFAKIKPKVVIGSMKEFSKPQYKVDVLKVEVPINAEFVEGSSVTSIARAQKAQTISGSSLQNLFREAAEVATKPFIYLSAGVGNAGSLSGKPSHGVRVARRNRLFGRPSAARGGRGRTACRSTRRRASPRWKISFPRRAWRISTR